MRTHTNDFKQEISKFGKQINARIYKYADNNLITESGDKIITENQLELILEQPDLNTKELISEDLIYNVSFVKHGQLLQSLMKEVDLEAKFEMRIGDIINAQFGLLVNGSFEYLDYGNYIIYSKEYIAENQTWRYVCYDYMLKAMLTYKPLNVIYPCTIRDYITAIANRVGLTFTNASDTFTNYNQQVLKELFEGQDKTYRDVLDKLSEITASNFLINDDDELELGYINDTNDTIDESYLKDTNINFGKVFGPVNKISIIQDGIEYSSENTQSIETNGMTQINIDGNPFIANGFGNTMVDNILTGLNGIIYSINNFASTGICYYDYLDSFNVSINNNIYKCLLLNDEIDVSGGLQEQIFTEEMKSIETTTNNYKKSTVNSIESRVEKDGIISSINQSPEEIQIKAEKISLEGATIDLTAQDITIDSDRLDIMPDGKIFMTDDGTDDDPSLILEAHRGGDDIFEHNIYSGGSNVKWISSNQTIYTLDYSMQWLSLFKGEAFDYTNKYSYLTAEGLIIEDRPNNNKTDITSEYVKSPLIQQTSIADKKKNFEKLDSALNIIKQTDIYKYNLKSEDDKTKKHIGLVIGDEYNYSKEITSNDNQNVDLYSMISVCFKAIQEQQEQIEDLQKRLEELERKDK